MCLSTSSNSSSERLNSRASWQFRRSPNIGFDLVEALIFLKSFRLACGKMFDFKLGHMVRGAYDKQETRTEAGKNDCLNLSDIVFSDESRKNSLDQNHLSENVADVTITSE